MSSAEENAASPTTGDAQPLSARWPQSAKGQPGRLETELLHASRLSSVGLLATGIVHDFHNLLSAIGVHVELAMMDTREPAVIASLTQAQRATVRARELAAQILAYAKPKHEERHPVQLSALVEEVLQLLRPSVPEQIEVSALLSPQVSGRDDRTIAPVWTGR